MNAFISFVIRRPVVTLVFLLGVTAILFTGIPKLDFDNSVEAFLPQSDPEYRIYDQTKDIYGDNGRFFIMSVTHDALWTPVVFQKINELVTDLEDYKDYDKPLETERLKQFDVFMEKGDAHVTALRDAFRNDPSFLRQLNRKLKKIMGESDTLSPRQLRKLQVAIHKSQTLKKREIVDKILSPFTSKDITGENDTLDTYDLISKDENDRRILPQTPEEFKTFRARLTRNPAFENGIYSRDPKTGKITDFGIIVKFINVKDQDAISKELLEIIQSYDTLKIVSQGAPVVNIYFNNYLRQDLFSFLPFTLIVVVLVFFFNFRSFRGVLLPSITLSMSTLWILGLMGHCGIKITGLGISLPPLMIAVGSSYSIHILNQYYSDFDMIGQKGRQLGLTISMAHISTTVLLAALTTFVAFSTLATSQLTAIREWGIFSGIGVIFALFISATLIPAGLKLLPHKQPRLMMKKNQLRITLIDRVIALMAEGAIHHSRKVLLVLGILIAISVIGLFRLRVESEFLQYFKESDIVRTSARIIEKKFGGRWGFNILVDSGETDGVKDPKLLRTVEEIRDWLTAESNANLNIGRTDSFNDFIKTMHFAMNQDNKAFYRIPDNKMDIWDYLEIYSGDDEDSDGRVDDFESYVDPEFRTSNLLARFCQKGDTPIGTTEIKRIFKQINHYLENHLPPQFKARITGFPMMSVKMAHYIVTGQLQSLLLSLVVIAVIVILLFKKFRAGLFALIPMTVAVIINFGIMGWFGINLDTVTSIIAAITVGIGVDDTIHFLNSYRYNRKLGFNRQDTIRRTLEVSGKAIVFTSLALILGFSVLTISSFKPVILFGVLMAITMIATTIGALLILPAVINITGFKFNKVDSESKIWRYFDLGRIFGLKERR